MKKVLLVAVMLSSIGAYAQELPVKTDNAVGIETTEPRATLDVNGNLRVQSTTESKIPANEDCPCFLVVDGNGEVKRVPIGKGTGIGTGSGSGTTTGSDGTTIIGGVSPVDGGVANPYVLTPDETLELDWSTYDSNLRTVKLSVNLPSGVPYSAYMSPTIELPTVDGGKRKVSITYPKGTTDGSKKITATLLFDDKYVPKLRTSESEAENFEIPLYFNGVKQTAKLVLHSGKNAVQNTEYGEVFTYPVVKIGGKQIMAMNLGAEYAKEATTNPAVLKAWRTNNDWHNDYKAYGSLFQWGRSSDQHELIDWKSKNKGDIRYPKKEWKPLSQLSLASDQWVCPDGWRVPSQEDFKNMILADGGEVGHAGAYNTNIYNKRKFAFTRGLLRQRQSVGTNDKIFHMWTKYRGNVPVYAKISSYGTAETVGIHEEDQNWALPVRCIKK